MSTNSQARLMTEGSIASHLIAFATPLLLGNLFQQLYNTADSLIVGNFLGSDALAAVSSSINLIHLLIGFFNGIAIGAGVVISRHYGAKEIHRVQSTIHTFLVFGMICGLILTGAGVTLTPILLRWMGTPESVLPNSIAYFRIYFLGSIPFVLYNVCMGILQAVGDSRHPLQYLIVSSIINIALDLLFVGALGFGVGSAAAATAISQLISALLSLHRLMHSEPAYRIDVRKLGIDRRALADILRNGIPAGLTNSIISIANVVIQANINAFGAEAMAGCGAHYRIEGFGFLPVNCFNMALTTFVGQNLGAGKRDRVKKGVFIGLIMSVTIAEVIGLLIYTFSPTLISLFDRNPNVVSFGVLHERITTPFFFLMAFTHGMGAVMRGAGRASVPMLVMLLCWCIIRVSYVTIAVRFFPVLQTVSWAYPISWLLSSIVFAVYALKVNWLNAPESN